MSATGAPTDGYHLEGERVIDRGTGEEFVCVAPGHPGTWVSTRGVGGGTSVTVLDEGVDLGDFAELDFAGSAVEVTDAGGGRVLVTVTASSLTQEQVEDFVGALIQDSAVLDATYNDASGALTITIKAGACANSMLADMAQATIKGRAAGAGTGVPVDLTAAQVKTLLAIAAADVSDFDTQVRTSRLDQMAAPTADVALNNRKLTGLADPASAQDAATRAYVLAQIAALVNSAPGVLDTLGEIATALQADESTAAALATTVAGKVPLSTVTTVDDLIVATGNAAVTRLGVAASRIIGKKASGGLGALTAAEIVAILSGTIAESDVAGLVADLAARLQLSPTAVKTANYSAAAGELVRCDTSGGAFAVTLPTAPADGTLIGLKLTTAGNVLTFTLGGSDVINKAGGATSGTLTYLNQAVLLQYKSSGAVWIVVADDMPKSVLDTLYAPIASPTFTGVVTAPEFSPSGLTGAVTATRYVGGTAGGPPTSGTFVAGDFIITTTGGIWICVTGGTPGTWVAAGAGQFVRKTSDETVTSSIALQDDNELLLALAASSTYIFEAVLAFDGAATGDINVAFTVPAGAVLLWHSAPPGQGVSASPGALSGASVGASGTGTPGGAVGAATKMPFVCRGIVRTGVTAGNLTTQWAQRVSDGTATTVFTDSFLTARRVA